MNSPTVCLNMIVKDESSIIRRTLENLCEKIHFSYWVICDTGSSDNTKEIIKEFFETKGIRGELYIDEWKNFAHNRSLALKRAYKKTDLLFIFDADDKIEGNIVMPTKVEYDEYRIKIGSHEDITYARSLLINNHKKFAFFSVIHEYLSCLEPSLGLTTLEGDYYVVSGRSGSRSNDPNKYLKDALLLESEYKKAKSENDDLYMRYSYYCANSYRDHGNPKEAIKWYKIVLSHEKQWCQEKYDACKNLYDCYNKINEKETGIYYLVESFKYDPERVDCLYELLVHYCCNDMYTVAYNYYLIVKDSYENNYLTMDLSTKQFADPNRYNFYVPYYMIIIADRIKDRKCGLRMYEIIFIKKQKMINEWYIRNVIYNLQFYLPYIQENRTYFINLANEYMEFLHRSGYHLSTYDFLSSNVYSINGINTNKYTSNAVTMKPSKFSKEECMNSKNILIYTGFAYDKWNYTTMLKKGLGGSETAVAYITQYLPKEYNIYISGDVEEETMENIQYIHLCNLNDVITKIPFHTVIVSRYIAFYEMFKECSFYRSYIWAHDTYLLPYGSNMESDIILKKWDNYINGVVCLTKWHKDKYAEIYPVLKNKISIINNGIIPDKIRRNVEKIKNRFVYTSRPERGLFRLIELWSSILKKIPDATLHISTYTPFPTNEREEELKRKIDSDNSIRYLGKLSPELMYEETNKAEYWLYTCNNFQETSCIVSLEMLMSEVICIYYPEAGLPYTIDKYGIQVQEGDEIDVLLNLTEETKREMRTKGKEYAERCSWKNRAEVWKTLLF